MDFTPLVSMIRQTLPSAVAIYVFGSVARGDETAGSDLDLAVLAPHQLDPVARWTLAQRLAETAGRDVDLVDLRAASTVMRVQVFASSKLLYEGDRTARALFEATALADYARLNEERRAIVEDARASGRIHG